jgi:hypothetical protein
MSHDEIIAILAENRQLRIELDTLRADLAARQNTLATPAVRIQPYTVKEFAALIRRHDEFVSDRCRTGLIRSLPGKPYRIPPSELSRWTEGGKRAA